MTRIERALKTIEEEMNKLRKERDETPLTERWINITYQLNGLSFAKTVLECHKTFEDIERSFENERNETY